MQESLNVSDYALQSSGMNNLESENIGPLFATWLPVGGASCFPPEPVNYHQTVLEMPKIDNMRDLALKTYRERDVTNLDAPQELLLAIKTLQAEKWSWTKSTPGPLQGSPAPDSLKAKFSRWGKRKQESLIQNMAAFQVHSFAIEDVHLPEEEVREKTATLFEKKPTYQRAEGRPE